MKPLLVHYDGWLTPSLCQMHPDKFFVFGDNTQRFGMGGQAIIRNEPNAIGVATKRKPSMATGSFFTEGNHDDLDAVLNDLRAVWSKLAMGIPVVFPVQKGTNDSSLGMERAELKERAPSIYATIQQHLDEMSDTYGNTMASIPHDI